MDPGSGEGSGVSRLTVHNAEVRTATVEVRTLTISGKQVTLAVFRQLREKPLIAEDGTLNGTPWGTVNYHPDKCADQPYRPHLHMVWQSGIELLRTRVDLRPDVTRFWPESATDVLEATYCHGGHEYPSWIKAGRSDGEVVALFDAAGLPCAADMPGRCVAEGFVGAPPCRADADITGLRAELTAEIAEEVARRRRRSDAVAYLRDGLPQLFIAV